MSIPKVTLDEWYRHRLRMCIWKCWKKTKVGRKLLRFPPT
ncbi:group II intron maturase-specific domain-containing protein [Parabacteroides leei]|nr:group II intron maturase-specific domain-containing protein [uncultured Parabacteroides sp.]